jgi:DNA-binding transcriptional MerR regulator
MTGVGSSPLLYIILSILNSVQSIVSNNVRGYNCAFGTHVYDSTKMLDKKLSLAIPYMWYMVMAKKTEFFHVDVVKIFPEVNISSLMKWVNMGLVGTIYEPGTSAGKRIYGYSNLLEIGFVQQLAYYGMSTTKIKSFLDDKSFRQKVQLPEFSGYFLYGLGTAFFKASKDELGERYEEITQFYRNNSIPVFRVSDELPDPTTAYSYLVVSFGALKKEINRRLDEEGWL